jgi:CBS domain-containing protein
LAVISVNGELAGIVTDWDVTRASATACAEDVPLAEIMTREVVTARPDEPVLDVVRRLESYEISAMPVVDDGRVRGIISGDLLARRTLYRLLQAEGA